MTKQCLFACFTPYTKLKGFYNHYVKYQFHLLGIKQLSTMAAFHHHFGEEFTQTYVGATYTCSICMVETTIDEEETNNCLAHFNGCTHTACVGCLTTWMEEGRYDCPQCRTQCSGIQTVPYTLHVSNQEYMLLGSEIKELQKSVEERTQMNTLLRSQIYENSCKIEQLAAQYGHYGCNDQIAAATVMEETAGIMAIPQHVRSQDTTPDVFALADDIQKTSENEMSFKMNFIQMNNSRNEFAIKRIQTYRARRRKLESCADMLLSGYCAIEPHLPTHDNMDVSEEEEEDDTEEEGIGCNECYACVTGGSSPCLN